MFVNTTPHSIKLRFENDTIIEIPPTEDEEIKTLFRCETFAPKKSNFQLDGFPEIKRTGSPSYFFNEILFYEVFAKVDKKIKTCYLMSTISGLAWKESLLRAPDNCRFMVPYSGPDMERCLREKGNIVWVAELIDYT
jgi:hypothetical protein